MKDICVIGLVLLFVNKCLCFPNERGHIPRISDKKCEIFSKIHYPNYGYVSTYVSRGNESALGDFPYMAAIYLGNNILCSGFLIDKEFILTVKHFYDFAENDLYNIKLGIVDLNISDNSSIYRISPQTFKIKQFINYTNSEDDIGLIELDGEANFNEYVRPVCLSSDMDDNFTEGGRLAGWGFYERNGRTMSQKLRNSIQYPSNIDICRSNFRGFNESINFCAANNKENSGCGGDSGSPIVKPHPKFNNMHVAFGFQAHAIGAGCGTGPALFYKIAPYLDWIEKEIVFQNESN